MTPTPTPWSLNKGRTLTNLKGPNGEQISQFDVENEANAAYIVKSANNYGIMVSLLKSASKEVHNGTKERIRKLLEDLGEVLDEG